MSLPQQWESKALQESEDTLRDLARCFENIGISRAQIAMMLRALADEYSPPIVIHSTTVQ